MRFDLTVTRANLGKAGRDKPELQNQINCVKRTCNVLIVHLKVSICSMRYAREIADYHCSEWLCCRANDRIYYHIISRQCAKMREYRSIGSGFHWKMVVRANSLSFHTFRVYAGKTKYYLQNPTSNCWHRFATANDMAAQRRRTESQRLPLSHRQSAVEPSTWHTVCESYLHHRQHKTRYRNSMSSMITDVPNWKVVRARESNTTYSLSDFDSWKNSTIKFCDSDRK